MAAPAASPASHAAATSPLQDAVNAINHFLGISLKVGGVTLNLGSLLVAVVVVLVAILVSRLLRAGLTRYGRRHQTSQSTLYALSRVLHYIVLVIGILWALSVAGIPLNEFAFFAGALGVGLGFGLQAIFSNFISGLIILFDRSLKVGDFVELANGVHGRVSDIHIRATRITTNDNIDILVPNSRFITDNVVNLTWRDVSRRSHIPFRVPYGADKDKVRQAALEAAAEVPFTLTDDESRQPQVWLTGFGESAMDFALVVWLNAGAARRYRGVTAAYNWALHNALEKHHLELPFPQRDLHVKSWLGLTGADGRRAMAAGESWPASTRERPHAVHAPADNDAARSVSSDIAQDQAGATKIADSDNRDERVTGIRERAAADHDGETADANAAPTEHTKPKGQQAHEQDD
jgi:small-conductance mechanosensitive channel